MGLLNSERTKISGEAKFGDRNLLSAADREMRDIRGKDMAMIFQDPFACPASHVSRSATRSQRR